MNLHISFKSAKSPDAEKEIGLQAEKLGKYLQVFRPELVHLHGSVSNGPRDQYTVSLNLRLPTGQITAHDSATSTVQATKQAFSELVRQVKRHKELLRNEHKWRRNRVERRTFLSAVEREVDRHIPEPNQMPGHPRRGAAVLPELTAESFLPENRPSVQSDVREYLDANLWRLERFVGRELRFRENSGFLLPGQLTPEEVVDEVVVAALSVDDKPPHLTLERWLYRLAIRAIPRLAMQLAPVEDGLPLEQSVQAQNVTGSDESLLQYHQPGETMSREDVIADRHAGSPEDQAFSDELIEQVEHALHGATPHQRESFILFALEGFTLDEVAHVTERGPEAVRMEVEAARRHVLHRLPPGNLLKERLMRHSDVA